jgi:hypothetical protein
VGVVFDTRWMQRLLSFLVTETLPSIKIRYAFAYSQKKKFLKNMNGCFFMNVLPPTKEYHNVTTQLYRRSILQKKGYTDGQELPAEMLSNFRRGKN